jgi:hypothetical protein
MTDPVGFLPPDQIKEQQSDRLSKQHLARFPISSGDVVTVGPHQLSCFDIEHQLDSMLDAIAQRSINGIYTDLPWGPALASGFRRKAGMPQMTSDYEAFKKEIAALLLRWPVPFVLEMGRTWTQKWVGVLRDQGVLVNGVAEGVYYKTKPMDYIVGGIEDSTLADTLIRQLTGVDDDYGPGVFLDVLPDVSHVLDPCCGKGLTARHALYRGRTFTGNEMAPYRAAGTLGVLNA